MPNFNRQMAQERLLWLARNVYSLNDAKDLIYATNQILSSVAPVFELEQKKIEQLKSGEVIVPMKAATLGEFHENIEFSCPNCCGDEGNEDCEICEGSGSYNQRIPVSWSTCKDIYDCMHKVKVKELWPNE